MRRTGRVLLPLLAACLAACVQPPPPTAAAAATTAASAEAAPVAQPPSPTAVADSGLAIALARDAAARAAREQTLRVQAQLRARENANQQVLRAMRDGSSDTRCMAGQKMRRVANGWVQDGLC